MSDLIKLRAGIRYNHDNGAERNALNQLRGPDEVPIANIVAAPAAASGLFAAYTPTLLLPGSAGYDSVNQTFSQDIHNTAVTGRVGIDFTPTKDSLIYANYSRGYRSSAFNAQFLFTFTDFTKVEPETLDSVELGFKTAWLDNRLQIDGALFHYQYKNQQIINVYPTGQQPLINLPKSKIDGGELEIVVRPVRDFTARVGLGFLNSKVQEGTLASAVSATNPSGDVSGQKLPNSPSVSANVSADWDVWRNSDIALRLHIDSSYAARQYLALPQDDAISQDAYALVNARIALHSPEEKWNFGIWGNNLSNKFFLTNAVNVQGFGFDYRHRGVPRTYGIDATYKF